MQSTQLPQEITAFGSVRPIDQAVIDLLRQEQGLTVHALIERLEVTATAVRQRLDRLFQVNLIERRKEGIGRGRPQFKYYLTSLGMRLASASYADLAWALWQEVLELSNPLLRKRILRRVAQRMGEQMRANIPLNGSLFEKMGAIVSAFSQRKVPAGLHEVDHLPVLQVHACPYPELAEQDSHRTLCNMEQEMISEAIGVSVQLDCCRLDGHHLCQFRPVVTSTNELAVSEKTGA